MAKTVPLFHETQVVDIARRAGALILDRLADPASLGIEAKSDDSPVTAADRGAHELILRDLCGAGLPNKVGHCLTPDIPVMSEEMTLAEQQAIMKSGTYWCVDPLDGTKTAVKYAQGAKEQTGFGVLIALVRDGKPVFGVAHYPAEGVTYYTSANGRSAWREDAEGRRPLRTAAPSGELTMAAGYRGAAPATLAGKPVVNRPAVGGSRILRAAEGSVTIGYMGNDGPISFGYWDLAAPHAILKAAGGDLVTLPGDFAAHQRPGALRQAMPIRYDGSTPLNGQIRQPYLPACVAAGKDTLRVLGASLPERHRA